MLEVLILSFGLAMDAVAVSLVRGAAGGARLRPALEVGLAFGVAQGLMPLLGWGLGTAFASAIEAFDHWIAFLLLSFLGGRMILAGLRAGDDAPSPGGGTSRYWALVTAAIATSIDAAAAGLTLPLMEPSVLVSCLTIGWVTTVLCVFAYWAGSRASPRNGALAEVLGGIVLIGLGLKILVEHLG